MSEPIAESQVELTVDFDRLPKELKEGLEKHVRKAAKVAADELTKVEKSADKAAGAVAGVGDGAERAERRVRRSAKSTEESLKKIEAAADDAQEALFGLDDGKIVEIQRSVEAVQESLFDLDTVEIERVTSESDRAAKSVDGVKASADAAAAALKKMQPPEFGDFAKRAKQAADGGDILASTLKGLGTTGAAAIGIAAVAIGQLPLVAALAATAITGGLGASLAGVGIAAVAGTTQAQDQIKDLISFVKTRAQDVAAPFLDTFDTINDVAKRAFLDLEPSFRDAFIRIQPELDRFIAQLGVSSRALGPAVESIGSAFTSVLANVTPVLPQFLQNISDGIIAVTSAIERNPEIIPTFVAGLGQLVEVTGRLIGTLTDVFAPLVGLFQASTDLAVSLGLIDPPAQTAVSAVNLITDSTSAARIAIQSQAVATASLADELVSASITGQQYAAAVNEVTGATNAAFSAQIAFERSIDLANKALKENGRTFDVTTEKGRQNREALQQVATDAQAYIATLKEQGASQETVNATASRARANFIRLATSMTGSAKKARELANDLLGIKDRDITVTADTGPARGAINALIAGASSQILRLPVGIRAPGATGGLATPGGIVPSFAVGGRVTGPGGPTADRVPALLSAGEYVINAKQTQRHRGLVEAINSGKFASGGFVAAQRFQSGGQVRSGETEKVGVVLGIRLAKGLAKTLRNRIIAIGEQIGADFTKNLLGSPSEINSAIKGLTGRIRTAFRGLRTTTDDRLVGALSASNRRLSELSRQREKLVEKIAEARQFREATRERLEGFASVTGLDFGEDSKKTTADITTALLDRLKALREFRADVDRLTARGVDKDIVRQLLEAGPEASGAIARSLAGADRAAIARINAIQAQIEENARLLSKSSTDALFDAGKNAAQGFLTGLTDAEDDIQAVMKRIAKTLVATIRKELKISSPSRVTFTDGRNVGRGLADGILSQIPAVREASRAMATAIDPIGAPANTSVQGDRSGARRTSGATGATVVMNNTFHNATDPHAITAAIEGRLAAALR